MLFITPYELGPRIVFSVVPAEFLINKVVVAEKLDEVIAPPTKFVIVAVVIVDISLLRTKN